MSKKKPELSVGQIVYIETTGLYKSEPKDPREYVVTKINTKSIYAKPIDGNFENRFDKKNWCNSSFGYTSYIWLSKEDYWKTVKRSEDKKVLRSRIASELSNLSLEQLKEIADKLNIKTR